MEQFDFSEALRRLREGKQVKRASWTPGASLKLWRSGNMLGFRGANLVHFVYWQTGSESLLATDWVEVDDGG